MTGRQRHLRQLGHVPSAHDQPPRVRLRANLLDHFADLINCLALPTGPRAPLATVNRPQLALGICPLVPNCYAMYVEIANIGFAAEEPQQFVDDRLEMHLLRRDEREALCQIETHLVSEDAAGAGAG